MDVAVGLIVIVGDIAVGGIVGDITPVVGVTGVIPCCVTPPLKVSHASQTKNITRMIKIAYNAPRFIYIHLLFFTSF